MLMKEHGSGKYIFGSTLEAKSRRRFFLNILIVLLKVMLTFAIKSSQNGQTSYFLVFAFESRQIYIFPRDMFSNRHIKLIKQCYPPFRFQNFLSFPIKCQLSMLLITIFNNRNSILLE